MIESLIQWIIQAFISIFSLVLNTIFGIFGNINIPVLDDFANLLNQLWDFIFSFMGYIRSALLLDTFEWNLIITILSIKILYKPAISLVKMFLGWFQKGKVT